jgi:predicted ATP-grasp superfamily ATP-dependent carboligase
MAPTVLLTIGRMPKGLDLARGFRAAGARVLVADPFSWHVSRLSRDVAQSFRVRAPRDDRDGFLTDLVDICERERVDVVVPVSEEAIHAVGLTDRLPTHTRLFASSAGLVRSLHDKLAFNERAATLGLTVPRTAVLGTDASRALAEEVDVVLKPQWSCGGMGIVFVDRGGRLPPPGDEPTLVQQRIRGPHRSSFTVAVHGVPVATSVYQGIVFSGTVSCAFERDDLSPQVVAWAERFVRATGYHGFLSLDFILDDTGTPHAIECNPRVTSGVHFLDTQSIAEVVLHDRPDGPIPFRERTRFQNFFATLMEAEGRLFTGRPSREQFRALATSRDVVWSWRDPLPFLLMTPASWPILKLALFHGVPMNEGATRDVGWFARDAALHQSTVISAPTTVR